MKKQFILLFAALALAVSSNSYAVPIDVTTDDGALTINADTDNAFTTGDGIGDSGDGTDDNDVGYNNVMGYTNATLTFNVISAYNFEYLGSEAGDTDEFEFTMGAYDIFNTNTSTPGDTITVSVADLASWIFTGSGAATPAESGDNSANVWMTVMGNQVILGFDDGGFPRDEDYDDLMVAVSVVPVPAAVWLFGTAMLGLFGLRRKNKMEALAA